MSEVGSSSTSTSTSSTTTSSAGVGSLLARARGWVARHSSASEQGPYTGAFSYAAEWHSFVLGLGVGLFAPQLSSTVVAYSVGRGGGKQLGTSAHVKDMADEPAYAIGGLAVARGVRGGSGALGLPLPV